MQLGQEIRFVLDLTLAESYIYGTAIVFDKSYSVNIQQASDNVVILPADFFDTEGASHAVISFGMSMHNSSSKINISSEIKAGQANNIEVYLNQDNILMALANSLPVEMTLKRNSKYVNSKGR